MLQTVALRSPIAAPIQKVFDWHTRDGAFERLSPPWQRVTVLHKDNAALGAKIYIKIHLGPMYYLATFEIVEFTSPTKFVDVQTKGNFVSWKHQHLFHETGEKNCDVEDVIEYQLPPWNANRKGLLSDWVGNSYIQRQLDRLFKYRHATLANDFACMQRYPLQPLRILVSGATGLIGSALVPFLQAAGHKVWNLTRHPAQTTTDIQWDPASGKIEAEKLENFDAVIHLAGENIAGRWTATKKQQLIASRIGATTVLVKALSELNHPPKVLISASAVGYYGDTGSAVVNENSPKGAGFLSDLCQQWEEAAQAMQNCRVVLPRFGMVLSSRGGALKKMLTPFKLCLGGNLGDGKQFYSWIGIDDAVYQLYSLLMDERLQGPVNLVAPNPADNATFTKTLGRVLNRPTVLSIPAAAVRIAFGEMGKALLLCSCKAMPQKLTENGLPFAFPDLESCLRHILGRHAI